MKLPPKSRPQPWQTWGMMFAYAFRWLPWPKPLRRARIDIYGTEAPIGSPPSLQLSLSWSDGALELTWKSREGDAGRDTLKDGNAIRFVFADDGHAVAGHELKMGDPAPPGLE